MHRRINPKPNPISFITTARNHSPNEPQIRGFGCFKYNISQSNSNLKGNQQETLSSSRLWPCLFLLLFFPFTQTRATNWNLMPIWYSRKRDRDGAFNLPNSDLQSTANRIKATEYNFWDRIIVNWNNHVNLGR